MNMIWQRLFKNRSDATSIQAFRFIVVGLIAFAIDYLVLIAATELWHWHHLSSAALGYVVGLQVNYVLCVRWVFDQRRFSDQTTEFLLFTVIGITGLALTELILWLGTDLMGVDYRISKFVTLFAVSVWNFCLRKFLLFSDTTLIKSEQVA